MSLGLRWRIAVPYVALILAATLGLTLYASGQVRNLRIASLESQLVAHARLLADSVAPILALGQSGEVINSQASRWSKLLGARVTIIDPEGIVLGDSHAGPANMDNHLNRPEVQQALDTGQGTSIRFSRTEGYDMMYAAAAVLGSGGGDTIGFARVALPLDDIQANVTRLRRNIVTLGLIIALLAVLLALVIAERTARPVRQMTQAAERIAHGDLDSRLAASSKDEIGQLTLAFNNMADELQRQMTTLAEEQGRLASVLDHMADGVLITDEEGHVELVNAATARILGIREEQALRRTFAQVVPHYQIIDLWRQCRDLGEEQVETVEISHQNLFLQAIITPFQPVGGRGYLVILQDLTRIRRLETVRRDFISNISHELRTPLAGLKALVDTLRGGAIKDPPAARRFLKRMDSEVDSLTQMVQELLELSRVESGQAPLHMNPIPVADVIVLPSDRLRPQAERAGLHFSIRLPAQLPQVMADLERIQIVVTNLIHNAFKFTPPGGKVVVSAQGDVGEVVFSVSDTGVGIPAEDLPRIFERFYKGDRARSGGGTGLGLAIAKHVVEGHGGRIWAESTEGEGSTFFFTLPTVA